jgi:preprotein translocase subunit SecA
VGPVDLFLQQSPRMQADGVTTSEEQAIEASLAELVGKIHQAKKDDKPEFIEKLKAQIAEQFKLRHAVHVKEIEEMEKELEQAKSLHTKRNEKQEEIIERRLRHLLNELDDLDWNRGLKGSASQPGYYGAHIAY